jgi:hypothetical protein
MDAIEAPSDLQSSQETLRRILILVYMRIE